MDIPVFYDCEATGIGGLPIEIGWAFFDPARDSLVSEGHLIEPPPHWDIDAAWDPAAQALHGIERDRLAREGSPPFVIAARMNAVLAGRELFSDGPGEDENWLRILFEEAGCDPAFVIRRTHADVLLGDLAVRRGWTPAAYAKIRDEADRLAPRTHRAEADARHLALLWQLVSGGPQAR